MKKLKVRLSKKEIALLQKVAMECFTFEYQSKLGGKTANRLANLMYKLGLFVGYYYVLHWCRPRMLCRG